MIPGVAALLVGLLSRRVIAAGLAPIVLDMALFLQAVLLDI